MERTHAYLREVRRYYDEHGLYPFTYAVLPLALFAFYTAAFVAEGSHLGDVSWLERTTSAWGAGLVIAGVATVLFLPTFWARYPRRKALLAVLSAWIVPTSFVLPTAVMLHLLSLAVAARLATTR